MTILEIYDYYKLLGLGFGSSIQEVRRAFLTRASIYSPEKNPNNPQAQIYYEEISRAFDILSNPEKKKMYDLVLLNYYLKTKNPDLDKELYRKYGQSVRNPLRAMDLLPGTFKFEEEIDIEFHKKELIRFKVRVFLSALVFIVILGFFDYNYWQLYSNQQLVLMIALGGLYMMNLVYLIPKLHRYIEIHDILSKKKWNPTKITMFTFMLLFFATPLFCIKLEDWKKDYYLSRDSKVTHPLGFSVQPHWVDISYKANGMWFTQSVLPSKKVRQFLDDSVVTNEDLWVRYSVENPKVSEIQVAR